MEHPLIKHATRFQSHKQVHALQIKAINLRSEHVEFIFETATIYKPHSFYEKHMPQAGWYFVIYPDGYESCSPAKAFEEGYTAIM